MSIQDLINDTAQRPIRRAYIKRRLYDGGYESEWQEVNWLIDRDRVIDGAFGSFSLEIDFQPGEIGSFDISEVELEFDNSLGHWNSESNARSLFFPSATYLTRRLTKLRLTWAFQAEINNIGVWNGFNWDDGTVWAGEDGGIVFEGVIDKVEINDSSTARVTALPYTYILQKYNIKDLELDNTPQTTEQLVTAIMDQEKITEYMPFFNPNATISKTIVDPSTLEGTYWDVIKALAYESNSVAMVIGSAFLFTARQPTTDVKFEFRGAGCYDDNILNVLSYDDEGANKVRLHWVASGTDPVIEVKSTNEMLLKKYLGDPQEMDLSKYSDGEKPQVLQGNLEYYEYPRPTIEFETKFLINEVNPLDRVTISIPGKTVPSDPPRWDQFYWDDGTLWAGLVGGVSINDAGEWMVTRVQKDMDVGICTVTAEKIV